MSDHTKGPWKVIEGLSSSPKRFYVDVAHTVRMQIDDMIADNILEANAHLIAAAPDLLEACKLALDTLNMDPHINMCAANDYPDVKDKLYAAIEKAEGCDG